MLKGNAPCKCTHSHANHLSPHFWIDDKLPDVIGIIMGCSVKYCGCTKFEMDNLKFLEKEYDAKSGE